MTEKKELTPEEIKAQAEKAKKAAEKKAKAEAEKAVEKIEFRTQKDKNFVGFVHPSTRKLVTVDEEGKLFIDETDVKALNIARSAVDLVEI